MKVLKFARRGVNFEDPERILLCRAGVLEIFPELQSAVIITVCLSTRRNKGWHEFRVGPWSESDVITTARGRVFRNMLLPKTLFHVFRQVGRKAEVGAKLYFRIRRTA